MGELLWRIAVTFCEEGADWNRTLQLMMLQWTRHLLWGRCGLKCGINLRAAHSDRSPSVRKVRIEILIGIVSRCGRHVTFCEEGADWNFGISGTIAELICHLLWGRCGLKLKGWDNGRFTDWSPSVRKVRIEIVQIGHPLLRFQSPSVRKVRIEI